MRKPRGGMLLTKSPNGMSGAPFGPRAAAAVKAIADDGGKDDDHPDQHDQVGGVLAERHVARGAGDRRDGREAVLRAVVQEPEADRRATETVSGRERRLPRDPGCRPSDAHSITSRLYYKVMLSIHLL